MKLFDRYADRILEVIALLFFMENFFLLIITHI